MPITLSIQALIDAQTTALNTTINAARDNVKADNVTQITAQNTALTAAVNAARDAVNANVDTDIAALATVVTAARDAVNANTDTKTASVTTAVNAKGVIKSIQRGTAQPYSVSGTMNTVVVTISPVVLAKSVVEFSGAVNQSNASSGAAELTSSTELLITGYVTGGGYATAVKWQVVEYM